MTRPGNTLRLFALSLFVLSCAVTTAAQTAQRTFVSTSGSDANTAALCSAANPCRGFAAAQTVTTAGGKIIALTSGGYGPVEITKAIQITAPTGVYVAITAQPGNAIGGASGDAIRISAGASDVVVLRGLTLNNLGALYGIHVVTVGALHVESCVVKGFRGSNGAGIQHVSSGKLFVKDSILRQNSYGILVRAPEDTTADVLIDDTRAENNLPSGARAPSSNTC